MEALDKNDLNNLKNFFKNRTKDVKDEKDQILSIIGKHLEQIDNSKLSEIEKYENKKELNDLGNFIRLYDDAIFIEEAVRKAPDFLIRKYKKRIGVELTDVYDDTLIGELKITKIFKEIEEELQDVLPEIKGVYKIKFNEDLFFEADGGVLKEAIINSIKIPDFISDYIEEIEKSVSDTFYLLAHEMASNKPLEVTVITNQIAEKECKLASYKTASTIKEFWLLMVLKDVSDYTSIKNHLFKTKFQKMFICDFNNSQIVELKKAEK